MTALSDQSYLSVIYSSQIGSAKQRQATDSGITVRVIDYTLLRVNDASAVSSPTRYRLLTTLLDEATAPALALSLLYHQR